MSDIRAEMSATVARICTELGREVVVGETLVLLESMKMEIPVEAPVAGTVKAIRVQPHDTVREGDVLLIITDA